MPGLARRLDQRLKRKAEAEAEQQQARAKEQEYENISVNQAFRIGEIIALRRKSEDQELTGVIKELLVENGRLVADVEMVECDCAVRHKVFLASVVAGDTDQGGDRG